MLEIPLSPSNYVLILGLGLWILIQPHPVWPQDPPLDLFQATLTIERIDQNCREGQLSKSILLFGLASPERIISISQPADFCLAAFFDPNQTMADGQTLAHERGDNEEWMVTYLPFQTLRGRWGLTITYPEPHTIGSLRLSWKPKGSGGFPPRRFFLKRACSDAQAIDMNKKNTSSVDMMDVVDHEMIMIEYYQADCIQDMNIPVSRDDYEPDDDPNQATRYEDQEQIHSFHNPDDTDWITFWASPEERHDLSLMPVCPLPIDPNIIPFEATLVINSNPVVLQLRRNTEPGSLPPAYLATWKNETKETVLVYVKLNQSPEYQGFLPYQISLERIKPDLSIIRQTWKISEEKGKSIEHIYLFNNHHNHPEICRPLPDKYDPNDPKIRLYEFICDFETVSPSFSLWLADRLLDGDFDINQATVDLDQYLPSEASPPPPPETDSDCDGIFREEDPDPNHPNLLFRAGMNLYHHPFHPYSIIEGRLLEGIELCEQFKPYLPSFKKASLFVNQPADREGTWHHYLLGSDCNTNFSDCNTIFLSNQAGGLLYVYDDLTLVDVKSEYESEDTIWGKCFSGAITEAVSDPHNLVIELAPGLNIIGLTYYEAFTLGENQVSEFRTFGDQGVDSFALLRSINSPTTSPPGPTLTVEPDASLSASPPGPTFPVEPDASLNVLPRISLSTSPYISREIPEAQISPQQNIRSSILRYDPLKGKWKHCTSFFDHPAGDRFTIGTDEAYLVYFDIRQDPNRGKPWYPAIFYWP